MRKIFLVAVMAASSAALLAPSAATAASQAASTSAPASAVACPGKQAWPELVGVQVAIAQVVIERENPNVEVQPVLAGSPVTGDLRCDRVRVFVNIESEAVEIPRVG